jgi:hypothetical protein
MARLPDIAETVEIEADVYSTISQWLSLYPHTYGDRILNKILREKK